MTAVRVLRPGRQARTARSRMTEAEFVAWADEDTRAEWVDGEVILMSPDNVVHTRAGVFLLRLFSDFVEARDLGAVFGPNYAARFGAPPRRRIPDVFFVARSRLHLIGETGFEGAPDLIVEVVSPDSVKRDHREKYIEYQAAGVREYWLVDPGWKQAHAYTLARGRYKEIAEKDDVLHSIVLRGFFLKPEWLWQEPLPRLKDVRKELGLA